MLLRARFNAHKALGGQRLIISFGMPNRRHDQAPRSLSCRSRSSLS